MMSIKELFKLYKIDTLEDAVSLLEKDKTTGYYNHMFKSMEYCKYF